MSARWTALVLAGSRGPSDPVATAAGVSHKAFAPVAGRPMIAHVLDALSATPEVGRIVVSIEDSAPSLSVGLERYPSRPSPARSALATFDKAGAPFLITTADHPLLMPEMIAELLSTAEEKNFDVAAAVAERQVVEAAGNPARRTYLRFRDGAVSGCNLFACATPAARGALTFWMRLETERKRPWRMARTLGMVPLIAFVTGRLTADSAAAALGRAAGCHAGLVRLRHPDAAHDVDRPADLAFAERRLSARSGS